MKYKGKSGLLLWLALALVLGFAVFFWSIRGGFDRPVEFWGIMAMHVLIVGVLISFMARNHVTVTDTEIRVALGPTNTSVELRDVVSMKKVVNFVAASGASAKRIKLVYMKNGAREVLYLSPADRDGFIRAVLEKNPDITVY